MPGCLLMTVQMLMEVFLTPKPRIPVGNQGFAKGQYQGLSGNTTVLSTCQEQGTDC